MGARGPLRTAGLWFRRHVRAIAVVVGLMALAVGGGTLGAGWHYADVLDEQGLRTNHSPEKFDLVVTAVADGRVTLEAARAPGPNATWWTNGVLGLKWDGGYAQMSAPHEIDGHHAVRDARVLEGTLVAGMQVRVDTFAFPGDPLLALGLPFEEVRVRGPLGEMPAWFVDAPGGTWAIFVHGQDSSRQEMLRSMPAFHALGLKELVITYRNDEGAPAETDGRHSFGAREWEDLDAAARFALDHGAARLVLVGNSMGGGIVMSFLYRSERAARVAAVILDAPMLDFAAVVDHRAPDGVPGFVVGTAKWLTSLRFGVDWGELDYLARTADLRAPILLFHGIADDKVPVATSDRLAKARPDLVTYVRLPGVGHVRSWNADPVAYDSAMQAFLRRALGLP